MKIKKIQIQTILYANLLNPFVYLLWLIVFIRLILLSWWEVKGNYYVLNKEGFREVLTDLFQAIVVTIVNTYWCNLKLSVAYGEYLKVKWFLNEKETRKHYIVKERYEHFLKLKNK